jgi:hypothetical protein
MAESYRKLAFESYEEPHVCVICGFGIPDVLQVAHLDHRRSNSKKGNLVIMCPNCHRMYDLGLFTRAFVKNMRDTKRSPNWAKLQRAGRTDSEYRKARSKAAKKANRTRKSKGRKAAAEKAAATRKRNKLKSKKK